jgi:hypothetical protein
VSATHRRRRGYIEQLPSGSWRAVVFVGSDPFNGKPRYLRETATSYDAAEVAPTKLQRQVDEDQHPKTKITVRQAVEQWLDVADVQDTTRDRYEGLIRLCIFPIFGDTMAAKLDAELLERFYARLQRCRKMCRGRRHGGHVLYCPAVAFRPRPAATVGWPPCSLRPASTWGGAAARTPPTRTSMDRRVGRRIAWFGPPAQAPDGSRGLILVRNSFCRSPRRITARRGRGSGPTASLLIITRFGGPAATRGHSTALPSR